MISSNSTENASHGMHMAHSMDHGSMNHGSMDHGSMDHGNMNHGSMDHSAGASTDSVCNGIGMHMSVRMIRPFKTQCR